MMTPGRDPGSSSKSSSGTLTPLKARSLAPELLLLKLKLHGRDKPLSFFMIQEETQGVQQSSDAPDSFVIPFIPDPASHAPNRRKVNPNEVASGELRVLNGNGAEICASMPVSVSDADPLHQIKLAASARWADAAGLDWGLACFFEHSAEEGTLRAVTTSMEVAKST